MNILRRAEIYGLWDEHDLFIDFDPDVNFLIGANGSGKTTVINLIAASLNADFPTLDRLPFNGIKLELRQLGTNIKPVIEIEKEPSTQPPFYGINYKIRDKSADKPTDYSLDSYEEQLSFRDSPSRYHREIIRRSNIGIIDHLNRLVSISWLSIHRSEARKRPREDSGYESTVDNKLIDLSTELMKYFSAMSKEGADLIDSFQKGVFLSLIPEDTIDEIFTGIQQLDFEDERSAIIDIFDSFNIESLTYENSVDRHFRLLEESREQLAENKPTIDLEHFGSLVHATRIHSLAKQWYALLQEQRKIYEPRDIFLTILNKMLLHKNINITAKNELIAVMDSGLKLPIKQLSSGEKQLLIILGEALLQEKSPCIYIADEPELSLHVEWQEALVDNLKLVNPNAQTIFATHSPDIVSHYHDHLFNMEKFIS